MGSDLVAILCARFGKPLYVPTAMIKVNMRGIEGRRKKELGRDLARYLAAAWPEEMRAATDFRCPDLAIVGPAEITGYITELGVIPAGGDVRHEPEVHREDRRGGRMMFRGKEKIAIGMAQPLALPGSFRHGGESIGTITEKLLEEVAVYDRYGYDGVILQNFNDIPVLEASSIEAVAYMTHLAGAIRREFPGTRSSAC